MRTGTLPVVDQTKVVGLVALPGAMTGMLLAGASPSSAIRLQLVVMYMLLGGNAFAALVAGHLTVRRLFTADHQLIRSLSRNAWNQPRRLRVPFRSTSTCRGTLEAATTSLAA